MRACKTALTVGIVLFAGLSILSAQGADPRVGTWQLNVAKSKFSPGPAPKSQTLKIEAAGKGERVTQRNGLRHRREDHDRLHRRVRRQAASAQGIGDWPTW